MTNDEYHSDLSAISKTGLDLINIAPAMYQHVRVNQSGGLRSKALTFGRAAHEYIMEFDDFAFRDWTVTNDRTIDNNINVKDFETIQALRVKLLRLPAYQQAVDGGIIEHTVRSIDPLTGCRIKCRTDIWNPNTRIITDLKFVEDASPIGFERHVRKFRYHVQDAFYKYVFEQAGIDVDKFVFIAVEKKPPYLIGVYELSFDKIMDGQEAFRRNLDTYAECVTTGQWPEYTNGIIEI